MDWDKFLKSSRRLAPHEKIKSSLIGILDYRKSMHDELETGDFCWLEYNDKTLVRKVRKHYQKHTRVPRIRLYFKDTLVRDSDPVSSFAKPGDGFVMFAAVDPVQTEARLSTSALQFREGPDTQESQQRGHSHSASPCTKLRNCAGGPASEVKQDGIKEEMLPSPGEVSLLPNDRTTNTITTFDPNSIFRSPRQENTEEILAPLDGQIGRVIDLQDPHLLEAGVARARQALETFKYTLSHRDACNTNADSVPWAKAIDTLISQAKRNRTIIGVVGNTGAGKSSVINAILDEERLVPTNCMRACTAVVTEISWNSNASASKYRAEIEFISPEDWKKELSVLIQEFLSGNGTLSSEVQNPNSEAGVAWAKFRAVYPSVAKDELYKSTIPALMSKTYVRSILGTIKQICMNEPDAFYAELQRYVDSKEKFAKKGRKSAKSQIPPFGMEYWPLIKVVRIYTASPVLSTGAVIVDLPGVHDSNAARAAVAQGYMKQCTGLWIVAPINRAVDDKAAKTLLGDSFKRQLKYDGGLSSITFICSKTDDISVMEAIGSLHLQEEYAKLNEKQVICDREIEEAGNTIRELQESQIIYQLAIEEADDEIERYLTFQEQLERGEVVYAPVPGPGKRKKVDSNNEPRKRRHADEDDSGHASEDGSECSPEDCSSHAGDELANSDDEVQFQGQRVQLLESDIRKKIQELKVVKTNARNQRNETKASIQEFKTKVGDLNKKKSTIKAGIRGICISGRNRYSKSAIQRDFAAGIREIDQENAAEADEDNFDPEKDIRDYKQLAQSLPVFCVSSRAYQKIRGRMQTDDSVPGFDTAEETEIPQLQDHCRKLTEAGRVQTGRTFLTRFCQLLITARLWTLDTTPNLAITDKDKEQIDAVKQKLGILRADFDHIVFDCVQELRFHVQHGVSDKFPKLITDAIKAAPAKARAWGQTDQGGLLWTSYKAVVRRDGVYESSAAGHRDFNSDLVEPITKPLASSWEHVFHTYLPGAINKNIDRLIYHARHFHEAVKVHAACIGIDPTIMSLLGAKLPNYGKLLKDLQGSLITRINSLQRKASRSLAPSVAEMMLAGYQACAAEQGPGLFKRMKEVMANHVKVVRHTMFHKAVEKQDQYFETMYEEIQGRMEEETDKIFDQMEADYMGTFGDQAMQSQTKEDAELKSMIRRILENVDAEFEPIANGDVSSVNVAAHVGNKDKTLPSDDKGEHRSINGPARKSFKEADRENDNLDRPKPDELKSRLHGITTRDQVYDEDDMSDGE